MHSRAVPRNRVNELVTPSMPFSTFAVVLTRPAFGTVTSTWANAPVVIKAPHVTITKVATRINLALMERSIVLIILDL